MKKKQPTEAIEYVNVAVTSLVMCGYILAVWGFIIQLDTLFVLSILGVVFAFEKVLEWSSHLQWLLMR